jgi:hypothetical protein
LDFWDSFDDEAERTKYFQDPYGFLKMLIISKMIGEDRYSERAKDAMEYATQLVNTGEHYNAQKLENCIKLISYLDDILSC